MFTETLGEALGPVIGSFLYVNSGFGRTFIFFGLLNAILGPITWWILFCPCDPAPDASLITHPDVESGRHVEFEPEEEEVPIWTSVRRVLSNPAATVLLLASCTGSASFTFLDATLAGPFRSLALSQQVQLCFITPTSPTHSKSL